MSKKTCNLPVCSNFVFKLQIIKQELNESKQIPFCSQFFGNYILVTLLSLMVLSTLASLPGSYKWTRVAIETDEFGFVTSSIAKCGGKRKYTIGGIITAVILSLTIFAIRTSKSLLRASMENLECVGIYDMAKRIFYATSFQLSVMIIVSCITISTRNDILKAFVVPIIALPNIVLVIGTLYDDNEPLQNEILANASNNDDVSSLSSLSVANNIDSKSMMEWVRR